LENFFPGLFAHGYNDAEKEVGTNQLPYQGERDLAGDALMSNKILWLIIVFTILFIIGVNSGELAYLMNLGNTI
jgi:hypothetical protein